MITKKFYTVRTTETDGSYEYSKGYGRWTDDVTDAKLYDDLKSAKRLIKTIKDEFKPELIHVTLILEDTNDLLEKELDLG